MSHNLFHSPASIAKAGQRVPHGLAVRKRYSSLCILYRLGEDRWDYTITWSKMDVGRCLHLLYVEIRFSGCPAGCRATAVAVKHCLEKNGKK